MALWHRCTHISTTMNNSLSRVICIAITILLPVSSQYETIWNEPFNQKGEWNCSGTWNDDENWQSVCWIPYDSGNVGYGICGLLCAVSGSPIGSLERSTDISSYSDVRLEIGKIRTWQLDEKEKCEVKYSYDGGLSYVSAWTFTGDKSYSNKIADLGSTGSSSMLKIKLELQATANWCDEACYFDNIVLSGIPATNNPTTLPTSSPTPSPTDNPTPSPTTNPTTNPTPFPSENPTNYPSKSPSKLPTPNPTIHPSLAPTKTPTTNDGSVNTIQSAVDLATTNNDAFNEPQDNINWSFYILCGSVTIVVCCGTILLLIVYFRRGKSKQKQIVPKHTHVEMMSTSQTNIVIPGDVTLKDWLNNLLLVEYYDMFRENGFEIFESRLYLDNDSLKQMGVGKIGHRKLILHQVQKDIENTQNYENVQKVIPFNNNYNRGNVVNVEMMRVGSVGSEITNEAEGAFTQADTCTRRDSFSSEPSLDAVVQTTTGKQGCQQCGNKTFGKGDIYCNTCWAAMNEH